MIWTPKALIDAAWCLVHFEQKDARAWKALAYRIATWTCPGHQVDSP